MSENTEQTAGQVPHACDAEALVQAYAVDTKGLSGDEAARRRERYGPNELPRQRKRSALARLASQFNDALIYVLIVAAAITAALGQWVDTSAIVGIVIINAVIGFVQEGRAERALAAIQGLLSPSARVRRDGKNQVVAAADLVPGDIVLLSGGDKVPADLRMLHVRSLRIDEAALTGESEPVDKQTEAVASDAALGDRTDMAFSGTLVRDGTGEGLVVATGAATEIGAMTSMLAGVESVATPLTRQMRRFGRRLSAAIVGLAIAVFGWAASLGAYPVGEAFLASVGIAVAAIPQGLPAIMTITLAVGVQAMAQRRAVIRRMHAAETLGAVTTICSDKTGTLTRNEMTAVTVETATAHVSVTGTGYAPDGRLIDEDGRTFVADERPDVMALVQAGALCNDAEIERDANGEWRLVGDPTEGALLPLARKAGLEPSTEAANAPRLDTMPFSSETRYMATLHPVGGERRILVKGAPEPVLELCSRVRTDGADQTIDTDAWRERAERIAADGKRVLAVACRDASSSRAEIDPADVTEGLVLLGLVGMIDPPRSDAVEAVAECQAAGIRVKMITGDHVTTASAIAGQMGIGDGSTGVTGNELDDMDDATLGERVAGVDVFARVSPAHKLRLVEAFQANGEVVAMTGDGVNDAAALKRADVGVAMGQKGTEVAKEAAEIVLTDDNFASIAAAVRLGRTAYDNIRRSVLFLLPTNGGEALAIIAAVVVGMQLPVTPVQILWVNMVTAATLGLALAFEPGGPDVMQRAPRSPSESIVSRRLVGRIVLVALMMLAGTFGLYGVLRGSAVDLDVARTAAVNSLVLFEAVYLLNARLLERPIQHWRELGGNNVIWISIAIVVGLQLIFTYLPWFNVLLGSAPMLVLYWMVLLPLAVALFPLVELEKRWIEHRGT